MRNNFSTFDIQKVLPVRFEKLRNWVKQQFIFPTYPSDGKGKPAGYTRNDVYAIALIDKLMSHGVYGHIAGAYASTAFKEEQHRGAHFILFSHKENKTYDFAFHNKSDFGLSDFPENWEDVRIINLDRIRAEVDRAIESLD